MGIKDIKMADQDVAIHIRTGLGDVIISAVEGESLPIEAGLGLCFLEADAQPVGVERNELRGMSLNCFNKSVTISFVNISTVDHTIAILEQIKQALINKAVD